MAELTLDQGITELSQLAANRKLIVFVGSGISAGSGLPMWDDLLVRFIEFCEDTQTLIPASKRFHEVLVDARKTRSKNPLRVASLLKRKLTDLERNESMDLSKVYRKFLNDLFVNASPNINHELIVDTNYPFLLTSNYDSLLEKAARSKGHVNLFVHSYTYKDADQVAAAIYEGRPCIIHVHGDTDGIVLDDVVFTVEDYVLITKKYPGFDMAIQSLFLNYSVLFVGYGGSDPHFEDFIDELSVLLGWTKLGNLKARYFVALKKDKVDKVLAGYKGTIRTDIIALDDYNQTTHLLRELQHAAPRAKA